MRRWERSSKAKRHGKVSICHIKSWAALLTFAYPKANPSAVDVRWFSPWSWPVGVEYTNPPKLPRWMSCYAQPLRSLFCVIWLTVFEFHRAPHVYQSDTRWPWLPPTLRLLTFYCLTPVQDHAFRMKYNALWLRPVGLLVYITALLFLEIYLCRMSHKRTPHP